MYLKRFVSVPPSIVWLWVKKGFRNSSGGLIQSLWHPFGTDLVCATQIILDQGKFQVAVFRDGWYESTLFHTTQHPSTSSATLMKVCVLGGFCPFQVSFTNTPWAKDDLRRQSSGLSGEVCWPVRSFPKHRLGEDVAGCFSDHTVTSQPFWLCPAQESAAMSHPHFSLYRYMYKKLCT